jgi:lipopolysaccharide/colanic/teichoic acid biosynthesis glycosyltransferase
MKRVLDIVFAVTWLAIMAPLMLLIAVLIKLESRGPVLYSPTMVGYKGKPFRLFRFRTMSADMPHHNVEQRLTRVGALIRNYSLDHLPTLINLLLGDLTLIGPRPMEMHVVDMTELIWQQYFQMRPGLFNYAVLKLGKTWTPSRVTHPTLNQTLELEYRQKRSTLLDVKLFFQFLQAYLGSGGNVKARGTPSAKIEHNGEKAQE